MDHKKTHIYAFYTALAAVVIVVGLVVLAIWNQSTISDIVTPNQQSSAEDDTEKDPDSSSPEGSAKFFIRDTANLTCTKIAATDDSPVNNCQGIIQVIASEKRGDPAVYSLNITDKTVLIHKGKEADLTLLYTLKDDQKLITFTMDEENNAQTIECD